MKVIVNENKEVKQEIKPGMIIKSNYQILLLTKILPSTHLLEGIILTPGSSLLGEYHTGIPNTGYELFLGTITLQNDDNADKVKGGEYIHDLSDCFFQILRSNYGQ